METENIVALSKEILEVVGLTYDVDGFIYTPGENRTIVSHQDQLLVLAVPELIKKACVVSPNGDVHTQYMIFNPFKENVLDDQRPFSLSVLLRAARSKVFNYIVVAGKLILERLAQKGESCMELLPLTEALAKIELSTNAKKAPKLITEKTAEKFEDFMTAIVGKKTTQYVINLTLCKNPTGEVYNSKKWSHLVVPTSKLHDDLLNAIENNVNKINGVDITKAERAVYKELIEFIVPWLKGREYHKGVKTGEIPTLEAILKFITPICSDMNDVLASLEKDYDEEGFESVKELFLVKDSWKVNKDNYFMNEFKKCKSELMHIPSDGSKTAPVQTSAPQPVPEPQPQVVQQPVASQVPVQPVQQMVVPQPVMQQPIYQQPIPTGMPVYQQPIVTTPPQYGTQPVYQQPVVQQPVYQQPTDQTSRIKQMLRQNAGVMVPGVPQTTFVNDSWAIRG